MERAKSKMSVKFFQDVSQRHPHYMMSSFTNLLGYTATAVNGYRMTVASDLMLKVLKSGSLEKDYEMPFAKGALAKSLGDVLNLIGDKPGNRIKRDNVINVSSNLLR